jgi:hypothetical protein
MKSLVLLFVVAAGSLVSASIHGLETKPSRFPRLSCVRFRVVVSPPHGPQEGLVGQDCQRRRRFAS